MINQPRFAALPTRFVLTVGLIAVLLGLATHLRFNDGMRDAEYEAEQQARERVVLGAETAKHFMQRYLEGLDGFFEMLQTKVPARGQAWAVQPAIETMLTRWAAEERFAVFQVSLISADGLGRWSTWSDNVALDLSDQAHFRAHLRGDIGLFVSEPLQERISHRWSIQFTRRLVNEQGAFAGVAVLSVDPVALGARLAQTRISPSQDVVLWRDDGVLLTRLRDITATPSPRDVRPLPPLQDGIASMRLTSDLTGEDRLFAHAHLPGTPLTASVFSTVAEAMPAYGHLRVWRRYAEGTALLGILCGTALVLLIHAYRTDQRRIAAARRALDLARIREDEQRRVLDGMPGAVYRVIWPGRTARPVVKFGNRVYARLFGLPQTGDGATSVGLSGLVEPPVTAERLAAIYDDLILSGEANFEVRVRVADGSLRWACFRVRVDRREDDELEVIVLVTDIEQEKAAVAAAQAEAARREREMQRILDGLPAAGYGLMLRADGQVLQVYGNPPTGRLLRAPPDFVLRVDNGAWARREPPPGPGELAAAYANLVKDGEALRESRVRLYDGTLRWLRFHARMIAQDGDTLEAIVLLTDIEPEKAATAAAIAAARLATLGQLSVALAHEIGQPLTAIALYAEHSLLLAETASQNAIAQITAYQELILQMVMRSREITDHLRRFGRRQDADMEPVSLPDVVRGALLLSNGPLAQAHITLEQDLSPDLPLVRGRQVLLEQVLTNVLLNACDAIEDAAATIRRIRIIARAEDGCVTLHVADSGPGIPPQDMHRLFDPFFTTKPSGKGTGLGLSICQGILNACGGTIRAENAPDGGAVFILTLPRWQEPDAPPQAAARPDA